MPATPNGMQADFFGANAYQQLLDKIEQLRRDMRHIQMALQPIEAQARRNQLTHPVKPNFVPSPGGMSAQLGDSNLPADVAEAMRPAFSNLHNWCLSAVESYYAMCWAAFGNEKTRQAIQDFETKFKNFTSGRSIRAQH
jgi:hypothetical protein